MPSPVVSHNQRSHVTPYFNCLELRNTLVSLVMPLALHDASSSGVTLPKNSNFAPHFDHLGLKNTMVPLPVLSVS